jgi:hypothetical protein
MVAILKGFGGGIGKDKLMNESCQPKRSLYSAVREMCQAKKDMSLIHATPPEASKCLQLAVRLVSVKGVGSLLARR